MASNQPSIIKFAASSLERHLGSETEFDEFYFAYWQASDGRAISPTEAVEQIDKLCRECGIVIERRGKKRFLVGVRLKSSIADKSQRLGRMGREKRQ